MLPRPLPSPNPLTAPYWDAAARGDFTLPCCEDCGRYHFYPRATCPHCRSPKLAWQAASGKGEVYSYTVVHRAPSKAFDGMVPYVIAVVALEEGPHMMTRLTDVQPQAVHIGMKVQVQFEPAQEEIRLPVFRPQG